MSGLFVGLLTLDFLYLVEELPQRNEKIVALDYLAAAGGPATNAAIAFRHLGCEATLLTVLGNHPIAPLLQADLLNYRVTIADLQPNSLESPPTSSIMVTRRTGDRAVVSLNAVRRQAGQENIPAEIWQKLGDREFSVVLIDGHQMEVSLAIAQFAHEQTIPVVLDSGSWKPGLEKLLPYVSYAICSANFCPPNCDRTPQSVFSYLETVGVAHRAITRGGNSILFEWGDRPGEVPVPNVTPVDTLGAGDIFHGAFCAFLLQNEFEAALEQAAIVASRSCESFGTRRWLTNDVAAES